MITYLKILFVFLFIPFIGVSQKSISKTCIINSSYLKNERVIDVYLPYNYNDTIKYPCIYVLDGHVLGSLVFGISQFKAGYELIPNVIVVAIRQDSTRWIDCAYDIKGKLKESGINFYNFVTKEVIKYVDSNYSTSNYKAILGHSFTANYVNYFFINETDKLFDSFILISPYFAHNVVDNIKNKAKNLTSNISYYVSYSENDLSGHIKSVKNSKKSFYGIENTNFNFKLDYIKDESHVSMVPSSTINALNHVFYYYQPIYKVFKLKDLKKYKNSYSEFVINYYNKIYELYNIKKDYDISDLEIVSLAADKYSKKSALKTYGEFCIKLKPDFYIGYYALGTYYKSLKDYEKALLFYKKGYAVLGDDCLNKEDFYKDIENMEKKLSEK